MNLWNWVLVIAGALLILIEVALGGFAGFDLVLIGTAFVLGGGLGLALGDPVVGFIAASALCILYIVAGRRLVRARIHSPKLKTNTDALLGREGVVVQRIAVHEAGQVKLGDEVWRAEPAEGAAGPFEPGTRVTVAGLHGVTLQVR
uniref:NfeD family protein n=1 Tax=Eiseniibacteriota bacterium TaxID=2212470 RepID=A0A832I6C9_UNCEI